MLREPGQVCRALFPRSPRQQAWPLSPAAGRVPRPWEESRWGPGGSSVPRCTEGSPPPAGSPPAESAVFSSVSGGGLSPALFPLPGLFLGCVSLLGPGPGVYLERGESDCSLSHAHLGLIQPIFLGAYILRWPPAGADMALRAPIVDPQLSCVFPPPRVTCPFPSEGAAGPARCPCFLVAMSPGLSLPASCPPCGCCLTPVRSPVWHSPGLLRVGSRLAQGSVAPPVWGGSCRAVGGCGRSSGVRRSLLHGASRGASPAGQWWPSRAQPCLRVHREGKEGAGPRGWAPEPGRDDEAPSGPAGGAGGARRLAALVQPQLAVQHL